MATAGFSNTAQSHSDCFRDFGTEQNCSTTTQYYKCLAMLLHCLWEKKSPFPYLSGLSQMSDVIQFCQFLAETYPRLHTDTIL